ncbi:F-box and leucine-rich protein 22 [Danio rerio]|uniref:F-box and leucine-rich protein 22 n=1 Tax=Danio rerio TaxID=7955 RepID=Q5EAS7_DANRE|nr:F-box and leucine-rich protein 22 [Danio rerio]AAH90262.1 F-box and leucine-rich repeat protein 22 [Danio rerio]|eukprot:NP_001013297.1 F-box and leucine-rich protein 22 [Danio rerio]
MHLIELDQECLLHLFSYLDKDSRRSLSLTCVRLRQVFLDPQLWTLLHFWSPCELRRDNFVVGSSLRYLAVCWHSSRVKVCNIEHWMKTTFQKDLCSKHESFVSDFLEHVCNMCPNLISLTLSGCGHIMDNNVIKVLQSCRRLRSLSLENCARITDSVLKAAVEHGHNLTEVRVDFCRNVTQAGLQELKNKKPEVLLSALHSADMIPDCKPEEKTHIKRALQKFLIFS